MIRLALLAVAAVCLAPVQAWAADAGGGWQQQSPLPVRNLAPVTHLYGIPQPRGRLMSGDAVEALVTVAHANNFSAEQEDDTVTIFDGSTTVANVALRGRWGTRWEWGVDVPLVHHGGGFTDGFIENFHEVFGFPDANREIVSRDRLDYRVIHRGDELVDVDGGSRAGDVRLSLGFPLYDTPDRQAVVRALVELPTGEWENLAGSDSTDAALWLELVDGRWLEAIDTTVALAVGITVPGSGELLPERQRDAVFSGHLGLHYALTPRVTLKAQLDGHTGVYDDSVAPLGQGALLGTLGGSITLSHSWHLDLGLVEDLVPHQAPDVIFQVGLGGRF